MRRASFCCALTFVAACGSPPDPADAGSDSTGNDGTESDPGSDAGGDAPGDNPPSDGPGDSVGEDTGNETTGDGTGETGDDATGTSDGNDDATETGDDGTDTGTNTGTGDDPTPPIRFIAFGDAGEGNDDQYLVATTIEGVCAERGCDFAVYLGDNFYDDGVSSAMDQQFIDKFEMPYMDLDFPFYIVLGNHDYGVLSSAWEKSQFQIDYSQYNDKWILPAAWHTWEVADVQFFALDTTQLMWDRNTAAQQAWLDEQIGASTARWKIGVGHHPYLSNGSHGNAGNYEGLPVPDMVSGRVVKLFMDQSICGAVDVYFSGHDHTRQWLNSTCGTEFIVSGAGSKVTPFVHRDNNPVHWEDDTTPGFMWVEIDGDTLTGVFYDKVGVVTYERSISK